MESSHLDRRPFRVESALAAGVSAHRLRSGDLTRPIRGIRLVGSHVGLADRLRAYALHRRVDFAFSHTTAAILYGAPLPQELPADIHVSVPDPCRAPQIEGFVGHKLSRWEVRTVDGFPVTTPEQTWLDLAGILGTSALVIAGDFLVGGAHPLSDRARLAAAISRSAGRRGVGRARVALEHVRRGSESPGETRLRMLLAAYEFPEPRLNHTILDTHGGFVARVDFAYVEARVALEYEGDVHRVDREVWQRDIRRRERVEDLGWRMVRVTASGIRAPDELVARLRHLLRIRR
ncbi:hypothetical protein [Leifsonia sp. NPDC077715]|uniref:hypothetical protein n=1 Tax=Leifsonia sp. NPDC077715 TaxID=3155539 RepID=UPI00341887A0